MPRMTTELILLHPTYLSTLKDRELDLRGNKIPAIENLGVTKDSIDSLDLTDNAVRSLSNLPRMPRLKQILLANNPVSTISPSLPSSVPNLTSLVLTSSALDALSPTLPLLGRLQRLEFLSLASTPMSKRKHYRDFAIHCCRRLRVLDYRKVKLTERDHAQSLFFDAAAVAPTSLAVALATPDAGSTAVAGEDEPVAASNTFVPGGEALGSGQGRAMTEEERARVRKAIEDAESVEEVRRLQRMLEQGFLPKLKPTPAAAPAPTATSAAAAEPEEEEAPAAEPEPAPAKGKGRGAKATRGKAARGRGREVKAGGRATRGSKAAQEEEQEQQEEEEDE